MNLKKHVRILKMKESGIKMECFKNKKDGLEIKSRYLRRLPNLLIYKDFIRLTLDKLCLEFRLFLLSSKQSLSRVSCI